MSCHVLYDLAQQLSISLIYHFIISIRKHVNEFLNSFLKISLLPTSLCSKFSKCIFTLINLQFQLSLKTGPSPIYLSIKGKFKGKLECGPAQSSLSIFQFEHWHVSFTSFCLPQSLVDRVLCFWDPWCSN